MTHKAIVVLLPLIAVGETGRIHPVGCLTTMWISWLILQHALSVKAHNRYSTQLSFTLPRLVAIL